MTKEDVKDIRSKILAGIELSYNRLLDSSQKEDGELVISKNGKVVTVKASKLKKINVFKNPSLK